MTKERPILFNADMVRAILDGRKTQTRRIVKDIEFTGGQGDENTPKYWQSTKWGSSHDSEEGLQLPDLLAFGKCPFGKVGDVLWVRETWGWFTPNWDGIEWVPNRPFKEVKEKKFGQGYVDGNIIWAADGSFAWADEDSMEERSAWNPSIHMPRWASRINLEITGVRVERLQDISDEDAKAEGFVGKDDFKNTWNEIYGNWEDNLWVWCISFDVKERTGG